MDDEVISVRKVTQVRQIGIFAQLGQEPYIETIRETAVVDANGKVLSAELGTGVVKRMLPAIASETVTIDGRSLSIAALVEALQTAAARWADEDRAVAVRLAAEAAAQHRRQAETLEARAKALAEK